MEFETINENGKNYICLSELEIDNTIYYLFGNNKIYTKVDEEFVEYEKYTENDVNDEINLKIRELLNPSSADIKFN